MDSSILRKKFLDFFEKRGHTIVPSSSLLPTDSSVLLTTAGVQQFTPYYLGEKSPFGPNVTSCQKCFRTTDIEEIGDEKHLTFFEMLGNFSFGGYFKEKAISLALEFLTEVCKFKIEDLRFSYFKGDKNVPEDLETKKILLKLGIPEERIYGFSREDNFWGPAGLEGPCGPTAEIHYELRKGPCEKGEDCDPNCECGRFVELWNLVFNEYNQDQDKKLIPLKQKGVDTGLGLERVVMVCQEKPSVFETDLFEPIIKEIEKLTRNVLVNIDLLKAKRIITDHIKGSVFLAAEGVLPSNVEQGYILRRILRRAIRFGKLLNLPKDFLIPLAQKVIKIYQDVYPEVKSKETDILTVIQNEEEKFEKTLERGLKQFEKISAKGNISGIDAFHLYDTYGFPLELTEELAKEKGISVDKKGFKFAFKKHQEISRAGVEKKFGGIGREVGVEAIRLHTATHLLHQALREILGKHVKQMGSDITPQRLRFDFSHPEKLMVEHIKRVEDLVNQKIKEDLEVKKEEMLYQEAIDSGALAFFREKYPEKVIVYSIYNPSDPSGQVFSKEICAGPHVRKTGELGSFKIIKEESAGAGARRIRAILK
ncbi:MAG: alanine--tRNA ligase [Candidatus Paceibacterales bacterium]